MQFLAVFLGAFLGFALGIIADELVHRIRLRARGALNRDVIATEMLYNLEVLDAMITCAKQTRKEQYANAHTPIGTVRAGILQQLLSPDSLASLRREERRFLLEVVGNLRRAVDQFESWQKTFTSTTGLMPVLIEETGDRTSYRDLATDRLDETLIQIQTHLMELLIQVCNNSGSDKLTDVRTDQIRQKLMPTREGWPKKTNFMRWSKSSVLQGLDEAKLKDMAASSTYFVVWENDWADCPLDVIELQDRKTESEFEFVPPGAPGPS